MLLRKKPDTFRPPLTQSERNDMTNVELINKLSEIIEANSESPVDEIRTIGQALIEIADALKGKTVGECRKIMQAVIALQ